MTENIVPEKNIKTTQSSKTSIKEFLPAVYQTELMEAMLNSTANHWFQKPDIAQITGFIGEKNSNYDESSDYYLSESTSDRDFYQLQPFVVSRTPDSKIQIPTGWKSNVNYAQGDRVFQNDKTYQANKSHLSGDTFEQLNWNDITGLKSIDINSILTYPDLIDKLKLQGALTDNHVRLFQQESYNWAPPIDYDKFINFRNYYWVPEGGNTKIINFGIKNPLNINDDILGQPSFTSSNGVVLKSNMSIVFEEQFEVIDIATTNNLNAIYAVPQSPSGVGATLTESSSTSKLSIDGLTPVIGQKLLIKNQNNAFENGIYEVTNNDGITKWKLTRLSNFDTSAEYISQIKVKVISGSANSNSYWRLTAPANIDFSQDDNTWAPANDIVGLSISSKVGKSKTILWDDIQDLSKIINNVYIVENVGKEIILINDTLINGISKTTTNSSLENDNPKLFEIEYTTIARGGQDVNEWSRNNRWFHRDELDLSNEIQTQYQAQRPIIEFDRNILLHNYGDNARQDVDLVVNNIDAVFDNINGQFSKINGVTINQPGTGYVPGDILDLTDICDLSSNCSQPGTGAKVRVSTTGSQGEITAITLINNGKGYSSEVTAQGGNGSGASFNVTLNWPNKASGESEFLVDGTKITDGMRLLVLSDSNAGVNNRIYNVTGIKDDGILQLSLDTDGSNILGDPVQGEMVKITNGTVFSNSYYFYDGTKWTECQSNTKTPAGPLFDLYDINGVSLSNNLTYPNSDFAGNLIFGYKSSTNAATFDNVLGISTVFDNKGNLVFENSLATQRVKDGQTEIPGYYFYKRIDDSTFDNSFIAISNQIDQKYSREYTISKPTVVINEIEYDISVPITATYVATSNISLNNISNLLIDGQTIQINDVILLVAQTDSSENGVYIVRKQDDDFLELQRESSLSNSQNYFPGILIPISKGDTFANTFWTLSNSNKIILDTDAILFVQYQESLFNKLILDSTPLVDTTTVSLNDSPILKNNFSVQGKTLILDSGLIKTGDKVTVEYASNETPANLNGNYTIPDSLIANPKNLELTDFSRDQLFEHFTLLISSQQSFNGQAAGNNNFKDTSRDRSFSGKIRHNSAPLPRLMALSNNPHFDIPQIIDFAQQRFDYFKNQFISKMNENFSSGVLTESMPEADWISFILNDINKDKTVDSPFYYSGVVEVGSLIPPTPNYLGILPPYLPEIFIDDTYSVPQRLLRCHDGSVVGTFGDYRDDVYLEFENQIFSSIDDKFKDDYLPNISTLRIVSNSNREKSYSYSDYKSTIQSEFEKWASDNGVNYRENSTFDQNNPFSWNYSQDRSTLGDLGLGFWREIYFFYFDTDRPHSHPWEILGFSLKPSWWDTEYGVAPYTQNNSKLWNDIALGTIRDGIRKGQDSDFAKPFITSYIPSKTDGTLKNPVEIGLYSNPTFSNASSDWTFETSNPMEWAWKTTSSYRYSLAKVGYLLRPNAFVEYGWDCKNWDIVRNNLTSPQYVNLSFLDRSYDENQIIHGEEVNGQVQTIIGFQQWAVGYLKFKGIDFSKALGDYLRGVDVNLGYKTNKFVKSDSLRITTDNFGLIPEENVKVKLYETSRDSEIFYSGVVVRWTGQAFEVIGYDNINSYFNVIRSNTFGSSVNVLSENDSNVNVWQPNNTYQRSDIVFFNNQYYQAAQAHTAGNSFPNPISNDPNENFWIVIPKPELVTNNIVKYTEALTGEIERVNYGTTFKTQQEVFNFLIELERYQSSRGLVFDSYDKNDNTIFNWTQAGIEFITWAGQPLTNGDAIALSPLAEKIQIETDIGYISLVETIHNGVYSILNRSGVPISSDDTRVLRLNEKTTVSASFPEDRDRTIFGLRLRRKQLEHAILIDNKTIFDDIIYDPLYSIQQRRLKIFGYSSGDWNGRLEAPGYIINQENLIPNFEKITSDFQNYFESNRPVDSNDLKDMASHLIGYQNKEYLSNLQLNDLTQLNFYQGALREKGTQGVFEKILRNNYINTSSSLSFFEEWMFNTGEYGNNANRKYLEVVLDKSDIKANPQRIDFNNISVKQIPDNFVTVNGNTVSAYPNLNQDDLIRVLDRDSIFKVNISGQNINLENSDTLKVDNRKDDVITIFSVIDDESQTLIETDTRWKYHFLNQYSNDSNIWQTSIIKPKINNAGYVALTDIDYTTVRFSDISEFYSDLKLQLKQISLNEKIWIYDTENITNTFQNSWNVFEATDSAVVRAYEQSNNGNVKLTTFKSHSLVDDEFILIQPSNTSLFDPYEGFHQIKVLSNNEVELTNQLFTDTSTKIFWQNIGSRNASGQFTIVSQTIGDAYLITSAGNFQGFLDFSLAVGDYLGWDGSQWIKLSADGILSTNISMISFEERRLTNKAQAEAFTSNDDVTLFVDDYENNKWAVVDYDSNSSALTVSKEEADKVEIMDIMNARAIYDSFSQVINIYDPFKGVFPSQAIKEIDFILEVDPAEYNNQSEDNVGIIWGNNQVGKVWWDTSQVFYLEYETTDLSYTRRYWGKQAPGSKIVLKEWVKSTNPPSSYTGDGVVSSDANFVTSQELDSQGNLVNYYYFWIENATNVPSINSRTSSLVNLVSILDDFENSGVNWFAPISTNSLILSLVDIPQETVDLQINWKIDNQDGKIHKNWLLIRENDGTSVIDDILWKKMSDSLANQDDFERSLIVELNSEFTNTSTEIELKNTNDARLLPNSNAYLEVDGKVVFYERKTFSTSKQTWTLRNIEFDILDGNLPSSTKLKTINKIAIPKSVPDKNLTDQEKYGNLFSPRQSWFKNSTQAKKNFIEQLNLFLENERVIDTRLNIVQLLTQFNSLPTIPEEVDFAVDDLTELKSLPLDVPSIENNQLALVKGNQDNSFWSLWQYQGRTQPLDPWILIESQTYALQDYWDIVDWYDEGYSSNQVAFKKYSNNTDFLNEITSLPENTIIHIEDNGFGLWERYIIVDQEPILVAKQNSTIKFNSNFEKNGTFGFNDNWQSYNTISDIDERYASLALDISNRQGSNEIKLLINALNNDILTSNELNILFFNMVNYVFAEQQEVDWAVKSSYLTITGYSDSINQTPNERPDPILDVLEFVEDVKPYHVKIREFIRNIEIQGENNLAYDLADLSSIDFDRSPYFDEASKTTRILDSSNTADNLILTQTDPWKSWNDNYVSNANLIRNVSSTFKIDRLSCVSRHDQLEGGADWKLSFISKNTRKYLLPATKWSNNDFVWQKERIESVVIKENNKETIVERTNWNIVNISVPDSNSNNTIITPQLVLNSTPPENSRVEVIKRLDATERINLPLGQGYTPLSGMPDRDVNDLLSGCGFAGTILLGSVFASGRWDKDAWDTVPWEFTLDTSDVNIQGGTFTEPPTTNDWDIQVDGGEFVQPWLGPNRPEELALTKAQELFNYTLNRQKSFGAYETYQKSFSGSTIVNDEITFSIEPQNIKAIWVYKNGLLLEDSETTIDWLTRTISLTTTPDNDDVITLIINGIAGAANLLENIHHKVDDTLSIGFSSFNGVDTTDKQLEVLLEGAHADVTYTSGSSSITSISPSGSSGDSVQIRTYSNPRYFTANTYEYDGTDRNNLNVDEDYTHVLFPWTQIQCFINGNLVEPPETKYYSSNGVSNRYFFDQTASNINDIRVWKDGAETFNVASGNSPREWYVPYSFSSYLDISYPKILGGDRDPNFTQVQWDALAEDDKPLVVYISVDIGSGPMDVLLRDLDDDDVLSLEDIASSFNTAMTSLGYTQLVAEVIENERDERQLEIYSRNQVNFTLADKDTPILSYLFGSLGSQLESQTNPSHASSLVTIGIKIDHEEYDLPIVDKGNDGTIDINDFVSSINDLQFLIDLRVVASVDSNKAIVDLNTLGTIELFDKNSSSLVSDFFGVSRVSSQATEQLSGKLQQYFSFNNALPISTNVVYTNNGSGNFFFNNNKVTITETVDDADTIQIVTRYEQGVDSLSEDWNSSIYDKDNFILGSISTTQSSFALKMEKFINNTVNIYPLSSLPTSMESIQVFKEEENKFVLLINGIDYELVDVNTGDALVAENLRAKAGNAKASSNFNWNFNGFDVTAGLTVNGIFYPAGIGIKLSANKFIFADESVVIYYTTAPISTDALHLNTSLDIFGKYSYQIVDDNKIGTITNDITSSTTEINVTQNEKLPKELVPDNIFTTPNLEKNIPGRAYVNGTEVKFWEVEGPALVNDKKTWKLKNLEIGANGTIKTITDKVLNNSIIGDGSTTSFATPGSNRLRIRVYETIFESNLPKYEKLLFQDIDYTLSGDKNQVTFITAPSVPDDGTTANIRIESLETNFSNNTVIQPQGEEIYDLTIGTNTTIQYPLSQAKVSWDLANNWDEGVWDARLFQGNSITVKKP